MGSRAVIDVNSVILSKCHSGESLFEYYLQEFQYGKDVFQTTTIRDSVATRHKYYFKLAMIT